MDPKAGQFLGVGKLGGGGKISEPMSAVKVISKDKPASPKLDIKINSEYGKSK